MDDQRHRDEDFIGRDLKRADTPDADQRDDLARRRSERSERPALTRREREERWPIG